MTAIEIGNYTANYTNNGYAVVDSGNSFLTLTEDDYNNFLN